MLLKLEKCIPISHVTLETVPKYANIERPTSSQLYASHKEGKSQRVITERGGSSQSAASKHIKCKVDWKEETGYENVHK